MTIQAVSPPATLLDFTYDFTQNGLNNGNVRAITSNLAPTTRSQSYAYDELNRIATAKTQATTGTHAWGLEFGYDIWANLLSASVTQGSAPMLSVGVNTKNQINNSGFVYDAAGNLLADGSLTMTYDAENRMTASAGVTYSYDGDGRRVRKSNGKLYWYGTSALDAVLETDLAGNNPTEYVFFGGKRVARRDPAGAVFYYFADHLGSSRIVTNAAGTIVDESDYYPFGGERVVVNNDPNPYKFTGKERDTASGLDSFGARYFGSTLGRFLIPDPEGVGADRRIPQSWNAYAYVGNNPLNAIDPDGEDYYLIGGDKCGNDVQCDKEGFVVDDKGNRVVITDEQVLSGEVQVTLGENGVATITTAQGTFGAYFFDPNIVDGKAVVPQLVVAGFLQWSDALPEAARLAEPGVRAGFVSMFLPAATVGGAAQVSLAGPTLPEFTLHGSIRVAQRGLSPLQAQSTVLNASRVYRAANGMNVYVQQIGGNTYRVVIKGDRIHNAFEVSARELARMAKSGGWQ